jgi:hypothetical protein
MPVHCLQIPAPPLLWLVPARYLTTSCTLSCYFALLSSSALYQSQSYSERYRCRVDTVSNKTVAMFALIWLFWLYHCGDFCYKNVDKSNIVALHPGYNSHTIMKVWNNFHKKIWAIYDRVYIATVLLLIFLNRKILSVDISCDIYYVLSCHVICKKVNIT